MDFKIQDLSIYETSESLSNVVYNLKYYFADSGIVDGKIISEEHYYFLNTDPVSESEYISYDNVVESTVKGWITSSFGNSWGSFTASVENTISSSIASRIASGTATNRVWWNSGSFEGANTETGSMLQNQTGSWM
jgi:hypothetical protein